MTRPSKEKNIYKKTQAGFPGPATPRVGLHSRYSTTALSLSPGGHWRIRSLAVVGGRMGELSCPSMIISPLLMVPNAWAT